MRFLGLYQDNVSQTGKTGNDNNSFIIHFIYNTMYQVNKILDLLTLKK
jgi:hypothetical protein